MRLESDFLVLGSGIAGLTFALKAAETGRVSIVTKAERMEGATRYAQGGIASVFSEDDSFESHIKDTLDAGAGLCTQSAVEITVREGPDRVRELIALGVPFSRRESAISGPLLLDERETNPGKLFDLTKEGGHRARRILHASDFTGQAIEDTLLRAVEGHPNIAIYEHHIAIDLITNVTIARARRPNTRHIPDQRRALGAYVLDAREQRIHTFAAPVVVLATGGAGKVYQYTTNPSTATGDGIAMAYRAGARVANMEFMQFHPTCLFHPLAKSFLISEALRGEGGELVDRFGHAFMKKHHPMGSLAPRDIVARAIDSEMKRTGAECVYLDMSSQEPEFLKKRFPNIYDQCLKFGIDLTLQPIPVVPAAHYLCGGVYTDQWGESSIENLFAIGETACTGLHGANRLASNSLLEGVVYADRALRCTLERRDTSPGALRTQQPEMPEHLPEWDSGGAVPMEERINIDHTWRELRTLMWNYVGIVRTDRRLQKAKARLELIRHEIQEYYWHYLLTADLIELRNIMTIADLIVESALLRQESRGLHYNLDHPNRDDRFFKRDTVL
ncbi:MAG: L-aspartate oxidase [Deltaproteobacteria bacterium]|nr:L-aspartate oxidase [Deltaproteobacteria bacterium]